MTDFDTNIVEEVIVNEEEYEKAKAHKVRVDEEIEKRVYKDIYTTYSYLPKEVLSLCNNRATVISLEIGLYGLDQLDYFISALEQEVQYAERVIKEWQNSNSVLNYGTIEDGKYYEND